MRFAVLLERVMCFMHMTKSLDCYSDLKSICMIASNYETFRRPIQFLQPYRFSSLLPRAKAAVPAGRGIY
jgi:hypothetical protein